MFFELENQNGGTVGQGQGQRTQMSGAAGVTKQDMEHP